MASQPTFVWDGATAVIRTGTLQLRIQAIADDRRHWAVFDALRGLGTVPRRDDDATPIGELLLWTRLSKLLRAGLNHPGPVSPPTPNAYQPGIAS